MDSTYRSLLTILAWHIAGSPAHAGTPAGQDNRPCAPAIVAVVGEHAGIKGLSHPRPGLKPSAENGGTVVANACKVWPGASGRMLAAIAYDDGSIATKKLFVALLDTSKKAVVATYSGSIQEDAAMTLGPDSLSLDTAPYHLAPGVRAFGLDTESEFSQGCVDGGFGPVRTLFVQEGKILRPVLENFYISTWRYVRGGPSCAEADDTLVESTSYTIGVGEPGRHGFSSLRITATSDSDSAKPARKARSIELHYDGKTYPTRALHRLW